MRGLTLPLIMLLSGLLLPPRLPGQRTEPKADSEILTAGSGEATLSPQRAVSSRNAGVMTAVLDTLLRAGFPRESLQTVAFGVGPNYDYDKGNKLIDYEATAAIRLKVQDLSRIGRLIDQALAAGATDVGNVGFESDSLEQGRQQALARALGKARGDAQALATAAGGSLGRLLEVTARDNYYPGAFDAMQMGFAAMRQAAAPPISPWDVVVRVAVQARWEFVPRR